MKKIRYLSDLFEGLIFLFILLLFLSLGVDRAELDQVRYVGASAVLLGFVFFVREGLPAHVFQSKAILFFFLFIIFQLIRFFWGVIGLRWINSDAEQTEIFLRYTQSALPWLYYFGIFAVFYAWFSSRKKIKKLLWVLSGSGLLVAMNALPPLMQHGAMGYWTGKKYVFFHPSFYASKWISVYLISDFGHVNYVGDIIAIGFFAALGIFSYTFSHWFAQDKSKRVFDRLPFLEFGFPISVMSLCILAIILLFSRGTIVSFVLALAFFILVSALKNRAKNQFLFILVTLGILGLVLTWAGNLKSVWKELATLQTEVKSPEDTSSASNIEGAKRALKIYKEHIVWGVGVNGYADQSKRFASNAEAYNEFILVRFKAMCHYLHVLAEEGAGTFFYFIFLIFYGWECGKGFWKTTSRFQAVAALALFSSMVMIFTHAWINFLLQQFNMSLLVYAVMGSCLAVLRSDFQHD